MLPPWLANIVTHIGFKVISIILIISLIGLGLFTMYRGIYNRGYKTGAEDYAKKHPENIYYGPTTVVQGRQMSCFPIPKIGHFGIGFCHD